MIVVALEATGKTWLVAWTASATEQAEQVISAMVVMVVAVEARVTTAGTARAVIVKWTKAAALP